MIVLTQAVEAAYHERLDSLLARRIFQPLGMTSVGFLPTAERARIAPTELDPWRGRVLRGEVHDENAARLDGVSGHAGLFGSVPDLLTFAEWMMTGGQADGRTGGWADQVNYLTARPAVRPSTVREFTRRQNLVPGSHRALGWDTPSPGSSAGGLAFTPELRPHRLHRHLALDRSRASARDRPAQQSSEPHPRQLRVGGGARENRRSRDDHPLRGRSDDTRTHRLAHHRAVLRCLRRASAWLTPAGQSVPRRVLRFGSSAAVVAGRHFDGGHDVRCRHATRRLRGWWPSTE